MVGTDGDGDAVARKLELASPKGAKVKAKAAAAAAAAADPAGSGFQPAKNKLVAPDGDGDEDMHAKAFWAGRIVAGGSAGAAGVAAAAEAADLTAAAEAVAEAVAQLERDEAAQDAAAAAAFMAGRSVTASSPKDESAESAADEAAAAAFWAGRSAPTTTVGQRQVTTPPFASPLFAETVPLPSWFVLAQSSPTSPDLVAAMIGGVGTHGERHAASAATTAGLQPLLGDGADPSSPEEMLREQRAARGEGEFPPHSDRKGRQLKDRGVRHPVRHKTLPLVRCVSTAVLLSDSAFPVCSAGRAPQPVRRAAGETLPFACFSTAFREQDRAFPCGPGARLGAGERREAAVRRVGDGAAGARTGMIPMVL